MLDHVDVAQAHVHLLGPAAEEGPAVQQASPRPRRVNRPPSGERRQVDRAAVVEAEVPVAVRVADPERARAAERDGNRAGHGGQHRRQFSDRLRQVSHGRVHCTLLASASRFGRLRFSHLKRRHDRPSATPHAGGGDLTRLILPLRRALASYRPFS